VEKNQNALLRKKRERGNRLLAGGHTGQIEASTALPIALFSEHVKLQRRVAELEKVVEKLSLETR
jgi:hypothetical protein